MAAAWDFLQRIRRLAQKGDLCLVAVDYDRTASFLNLYGLYAVEEAAQAAAASIEGQLRLSGQGEWFSLAGWPDELTLAGAGPRDDVLEGARAGVLGVPTVASCHLPPEAAPFRCTASVAFQEHVGAAEGDCAIRTLCRANEVSLKDFKASPGLRGSAHPARGTYYATHAEAQHEELAAAVWSVLDADPNWNVAHQTRVVRVNVLRSLVHRTRTELASVLISPEFRGTVFDRRLEALGGGVVTLPDGTRAGKLGYLNRLFREHLTPNVIMDYVMEAIVSTSPWLDLSEVRFTRVPSSLCAVVPAAVVQTGYSDLCEWLGHASRRIGRTIGPSITVPTFRVALLPAGPAVWEWALSLSRHVFKVRCDTLLSVPQAFIFDYRATSPAEFEKLATYYVTKDSRWAQGWARPQGDSHRA